MEQKILLVRFVLLCVDALRPAERYPPLVLYIPALPKTPFNSEYVTEQAKLFLQGQNSPDTERRAEGTTFVGIATQADIKDPIGRAAMLLPIEVA
jgi:hypothetical protein